MLIITYLIPENYVLDTNEYFRWKHYDSWLSDDFAREMIADICHSSKLLNPGCVDHYIDGKISPEFLSRGVKTVLCVKNAWEDKVFNGSYCDDTCAKWLLKACENKDVIVHFGHLMILENCPEHFDIKFLETGEIVHTEREYIEAYCKVREIIDEMSEAGDGGE